MWRMLWGTLRRTPRTLHQTVAYLAYFIHLREYTDQIVSKEARFDYALTEVNFAESNRFGEGGTINMVRQEQMAREKIEVYDAYDVAEPAKGFDVE
jgi:hypothetical protein